MISPGNKVRGRVEDRMLQRQHLYVCRIFTRKVFAVKFVLLSVSTFGETAHLIEVALLLSERIILAGWREAYVESFRRRDRSGS
jgi:hypothetical protein